MSIEDTVSSIEVECRRVLFYESDSQFVGICHVDDLDDEEYYEGKSSVKFKCYRLPYQDSFVAIPLIHSAA